MSVNFIISLTANYAFYPLCLGHNCLWNGPLYRAVWQGLIQWAQFPPYNTKIPNVLDVLLYSIHVQDIQTNADKIIIVSSMHQSGD